MAYPEDAGTIIPLVDGTDYMEDDNVNDVVDELEAAKTLIGIPGAAQSHLATILDMLSDNYIGGRCYGEDGTTEEVYVGAFSGIISNAAGSIRKPRRITTVTTLTAADLDTGAMAVGYYYIYATADAAASTPVFKFSASASAPTGYTYYKKIGWFYNETASVLDVTSLFIGNIKDGSGAPNGVKAVGTTDISTTSAAFVDMTDMEVKFVSNGRPVKILFTALQSHSAESENNFTIDIDGSDVVSCVGSNYSLGQYPVSLIWLETLSAGEHTIKVQWNRSGGGTAYQKGATKGERVLTVGEK